MGLKDAWRKSPRSSHVYLRWWKVQRQKMQATWFWMSAKGVFYLAENSAEIESNFCRQQSGSGLQWQGKRGRITFSSMVVVNLEGVAFPVRRGDETTRRWYWLGPHGAYHMADNSEEVEVCFQAEAASCELRWRGHAG